MGKELYWMFNGKNRGEEYNNHRLRLHIWKFFGRYVFKCLFLPFNWPRNAWLRLFGAKIGKNNYISSRAIIVYPAAITMGNGNAIDDFVYFNDKTILGNNCQISSYVKIISGGHDVRSRSFDYQIKPVTIGSSVFVGANSVIMGGGKNW